MSYHNDPYRVDYLKIYPCLKERPDVLEVLKKSDRKMKYMDMTRDEYNKMRGNSVREVAGTHGNISFRDVLLFHQEE